MNAAMTINEIQKSILTVQNGMPEEAIIKVHNTKTNEPLLKCAAAFLRRVGN